MKTSDILKPEDDMKLIAMIPMDQVKTWDLIEPGYVFVMSQGYLKIYKEVSK